MNKSVLVLAKLAVYDFEGLLDVFLLLCTSEDDLSRHKDKQHHFGGLHAVNNAWEELWFVGAQ